MTGSRDGPKRLTASVEEFCGTIEKLPARAFLETPWGPRQVLAHLVFWHESYVRQIEAGLAGIGWLFPEGTLKELNAKAVASLSGVGVPTMLARFRAANSRLCRLAGDPRSAGAQVQLKRDTKSWPLSEFILEVEAHVRRHGDAIRRTYPSRQSPPYRQDTQH
jgi:hypothetical protein